MAETSCGSKGARLYCGEAGPAIGKAFMIVKRVPVSRVYDPPGHCIYCGKTEADGAALSREHIIPLGLSGELVYRKASCECCREKTQAAETSCLRHTWLAARTHLE